MCNNQFPAFAERICIFESEVKMWLLSMNAEIVGRAMFNLNPLTELRPRVEALFLF